jgi:ABC-2 type transport system permease protein
MAAILLSGYTSPVDNMPRRMQTLTWINPLRHFIVIVIVKGIYLKNMDAAAVLLNVLPLTIIAILTLTIGSVLCPSA